jgi:hypothetical protein
MENGLNICHEKAEMCFGPRQDRKWIEVICGGETGALTIKDKEYEQNSSKVIS